MNETCKGLSFGKTAFYLKKTKKKKNIKFPLLKNLHLPTKKNRTAQVFMQK